MIIDFVIPAPQQSLMEAYHTWRGSPLNSDSFNSYLTANIRPYKTRVYLRLIASSLERMNA